MEGQALAQSIIGFVEFVGSIPVIGDLATGYG